MARHYTVEPFNYNTCALIYLPIDSDRCAWCIYMCAERCMVYKVDWASACAYTVDHQKEKEVEEK